MFDDENTIEPIASDAVTDSPPVEMVPIPESTREDRAAYLERAAKEEFGTDEAVVAPEVEQKPSVAPVSVEAKAPVVPVPTQSMPPQAEEAQLRERIAKQETELKQKELFIQRRNSEFGELKKQLGSTRNELVEAKRRLQEGLESKFQESPVLAMEDRDQIREIDSSLKKLNDDEQRLQRIYEGEKYFQQIVGDRATPDELAELLRSDGVPEQYISSFRQNPYDFFQSPEALVQAGLRAVERKERATEQADLKVIAVYAKSLEAQIAQLKAKPSQVLSNVQRNLNQAPPFTSASGSSAQDSKQFKSPINMSRAERAEFLKNNA